MLNIRQINTFVSENNKRIEVLESPYDPYLGIGSPLERIEFKINKERSVNIPVEMAENRLIKDILKYGSVDKFLEESLKLSIKVEKSQQSFEALFYLINRIRNEYDFEFWAATTIKIKDKETGSVVPFILNRAQRHYLSKLEELRLKGTPIRIILLKARQWGGSTLTEFYASWLQLIHHKNWNSCIIGDVDDQARNIRGMYAAAAEEYPKEVGTMTLKPYEGSVNNKQIIETGAIIYISSMQHPEAIRSSDLKIAHFSETASYKETQGKKPTDLMQSIRSSIPYLPDTMIVEESTAKGVGNYFHKSWLSAKSDNVGYSAVFIPWYAIERYQIQFKDENEKFEFIKNLSEYDLFMWNTGATLEGIKWYNTILQTEFNGDTVMMQSEFPTTDTEAFQSTGHRVFSQKITQRAARTCIKPNYRGALSSDGEKGKDSLSNISFDEHFAGLFWLWAKPDKSENISNRYVVSLDIGGTTGKADWSVIRVFDRYWMMDGGVPEAIGTWRLHIDQDRLAWIAAGVAEYFNHALLVVESNSLKTEQNTEGDGFLTILDEIKDTYDNIYIRKTEQDKIIDGRPVKYGFHTNAATKPILINALKAAMRDDGYIERDKRLIDEADTYEHKPNGSMGAVDGEHDDILMSTAIGLWVCLNDMPLPKVIEVRRGRPTKHKLRGESSF